MPPGIVAVLLAELVLICCELSSSLPSAPQAVATTVVDNANSAARFSPRVGRAARGLSVSADNAALQNGQLPSLRRT
jgi:hypothetical protein